MFAKEGGGGSMPTPEQTRPGGGSAVAAVGLTDALFRFPTVGVTTIPTV